MIKENKKNALLEVGTEEIPFSYIEPALRQIEKFALEAFNAFGLKYETLKTYATSRRLVLIVENLVWKSDEKVEYILGPSLKVARDERGEYTQAAIGFASKNDVSPEKLVLKSTNRGDYLSLFKKTKSERTEKLLSSVFSELIKGISFPKTMLWEESGFKFARPIRNIVALYGSKVIKFKIADVISSNWSIGLHSYNEKKIKIDLPENYLSIMKNRFVIVEQDERREAIKKSMEFVSKNVGNIVLDESLIDEINYLVEYPSAILCSFDKKYLNLPSEVLSICMKKSQKCFLVNDRNNNLLNYFVGIRNGVSKYQEIVKEGYEKVLAAKLADAEFFYDNDLKNGLKCNIEKLKGVVLHNEIGTVYEKIERIKRIASLFNKEFNMQIDEDILEKAVMFSKADLVSEMVFEYPELQGVIGRVYAFKLGEIPDIALSIEQHYWPLVSSGKLPSNKVALLVSLSDKIDTLVTCFSIGLEPSGSTDPYGLRRTGMGFVRMVMEKLANCDLEYVMRKVFEFLPKNVANNPKSKNTYERLVSFLCQRIENIFEMEGYKSCEIRSVTNILKLNYRIKNLGTLRLKLDALQNAKLRCDFSSITMLFKRMVNIVNQAKKQNINISIVIREDLLVLDVEKEVFNVAKRLEVEVEGHILKEEYNEIFDKVVKIKPLIDNFFEKVMIMAENETIKSNRISLINYIKDIFNKFIDFSYLY
ncbi:MAG: glycine--tRNA ligase subunit beta [Endomicrobiia bacterium]|nr:MAG: glycine--tRNA ligase subunit beta [Endomicrobiia bacterium]